MFKIQSHIIQIVGHIAKRTTKLTKISQLKPVCMLILRSNCYHYRGIFIDER